MAIKHTFRKNGSGLLQTRNLTPLKAIRFNCKECMGFRVGEVSGCTSFLCLFFPFRMGKGHRKGGKNFKKKTVQRPVLVSKIDERKVRCK
jgi:hypothetical protein